MEKKIIPFNNLYKTFNLVSILLIIISLLLLIFKGLNYGVDFKGGTLLEIRAHNNVSISDLEVLESLDFYDQIYINGVC